MLKFNFRCGIRAVMARGIIVFHHMDNQEPSPSESVLPSSSAWALTHC